MGLNQWLKDQAYRDSSVLGGATGPGLKAILFWFSATESLMVKMSGTSVAA